MKISKLIINIFLALIFTFTLLNYLDIKNEKNASKIIDKAIEIDFVNNDTRPDVTIEDFYNIADKLNAGLILINRDPSNSNSVYNIYNIPKKDYDEIKKTEKYYIRKSTQQVKMLDKNYSIVSGGFRGLLKEGLSNEEISNAIIDLNLSDKYKVATKWHDLGLTEKYLMTAIEYKKSFVMLLAISIFILGNLVISFIRKEKKVALTLLYGLNKLSKFKLLLFNEYFYYIKIFGLTGIVGILIFYQKINSDYLIALFNYFGILGIIFLCLTLFIFIFLKQMKINKSVKGSTNYKIFLLVFKFNMLVFSIIIITFIASIKMTYTAEKDYGTYINGWENNKNIYKFMSDTGTISSENGYEFMKYFQEVEKGFSAKFSNNNSLYIDKNGNLDISKALGSDVTPNYFEYVDIYDEFNNKITSKSFEKNTDYILMPITFKEELKNSNQNIIFYEEQEFFTFAPRGYDADLKIKNPFLFVWNNNNFTGESHLLFKAESKEDALKKMKKLYKNVGFSNAVINVAPAYMNEEEMMKQIPKFRVEEFSYTLVNFIILVLIINSIVIIDLKINNKKYMIKFIYGMKVKKIMKNLIQDVIFINSILLLMNMFLLGRTLELTFLIFIQMFLEILYILIYSKINLNKNMYNVLKGE